jgi:transposase
MEIHLFGRNWKERIHPLTAKDMTCDEKTAVADMCLVPGNSFNEVSRHTSIGYNTLYKWTSKRKLGLKLQDGAKGGRYSLISEKEEKKLMNYVTGSQDYCVNVVDYDKRVLKYAREHAVDLGKAPESVKSVSEETLKRIDKKLGFTSKQAEQTTDARAKGVADIRHTSSFIAAQLLVGSTVNPALIVNIDATSYTVGKSITEKAQVKVLDVKMSKAERNKLRKKSFKTQPVDNANNGTGLYSIKYYLLISADGVCGPPVYVIQHTNMKVDDFKVCEIEGLGYAVGQESPGYLVIANSRAGNVEFYKWLMTTVLIKFVDRQRKLNDLPPDALAFFQLDGEKKQIECFEDPALLKLLEQNHIIVGKPPASTTATTQPCDCGNCFKASKAALKNITDAHIKPREPLVKRIKKALATHNKEFGPKCGISAAHIGMASRGLLRIQLALINTVKPKVVTDSFKLAGVYDYDLETPGPNIDTILGNCKEYFGEGMTLQDEESIRTAMPNLIAAIRDEGEIHEAVFDLNGIRCNIPANGDRDRLDISRRRYVFLTDKALVARETLKRKLKIDKVEVAASKKRAKVEVTAAKAAGILVSSSSAVPVALRAVRKSKTPISTKSSSNSSSSRTVYVCMNPKCAARSFEGDPDDGWLCCDCHDPGMWTCGKCSDFMVIHEK